jgi:eukaryotic-like serine/threonine-protein kinase
VWGVQVPPELIAGRYRVEREVGRGGMGSVWLCRDDRLGRPVAVKQVGGLPGESSMHLARALREARHSAALNHPNVVAIFDALEDGDQVWLVMEYVPSRTLDQIVREGGPLEPREAARIGADVADGLAAAHALGTVHRDVKPSNVLVRDDDGRALIADFGIARTKGQEQLTRSGVVTGTPAYFAPELARGQEASPASDVWALGVSLYVAVQGEPPYEDQSNAIALLNTIANRPPPAPTRAGPLASIMARMLEPDPARRGTMAEAAEELRRQVAPRADEPPTVPATASVAADPVPTPVRAERPPDTVPAGVSPTRRQRRTPRVWAAVALVVLALIAVGGWRLTTDSSDDNQAGRRTGARQSGHPAASPHPSPRGTSRPSPSAPSSSASSLSNLSPSNPTSSAPSSSATPSGSSFTSATTADDSPTSLVSHYYGLLPEDTNDAWELLTPDLQDKIGAGTYQGFWATVDDVRVDDTERVGEGLVRVTLTYTTDGRSETETRQLAVQRDGAGYLISDDQGAV